MAEDIPAWDINPQLPQLRKNIQNKIESGGNYGAIGPDTGKMGRGLGVGQVMSANLPEWSRAILGREISEKEFLGNKRLQDRIINNKLGEYLNSTGNPADAASMWFTGKPLRQGANRADVSGTTGAQYAKTATQGLPPAEKARPKWDTGSESTPAQQARPKWDTGVSPDILAKARSGNTPPGGANEQLRRDLHLPTSGQVRAEQLGGMDPSIAARIKQLPPQTFDAIMRDPKNPAWERYLGGAIGVGREIADQVAPSNLTRLAHQVGQETAENRATPETAGQVANLAQLGARKVPGELGKGVAVPEASRASAAGEAAVGKALETPESRVRVGEEALKKPVAPAPQSAGAQATSKAILQGYQAVPPVPNE